MFQRTRGDKLPLSASFLSTPWPLPGTSIVSAPLGPRTGSDPSSDFTKITNWLYVRALAPISAAQVHALCPDLWLLRGPVQVIDTLFLTIRTWVAGSCIWTRHPPPISFLPLSAFIYREQTYNCFWGKFLVLTLSGQFNLTSSRMSDNKDFSIKNKQNKFLQVSFP